MDLREILGLYYDSDSDNIRNAPEEITAKISLVPENSYYGVLYCAKIITKDLADIEVELLHGNTKLLGLFTTIVPHFHVNAPYTYEGLPETFELQVTDDEGKQTKIFSKADMDLVKLLDIYKHSTPKPILLTIKLLRTSKNTLRESSINYRKGGKSPDKYFREKLDSTLVSNNNIRDTYDVRYRTFRSGSLKSHIVWLSTAEKRAFVCEYLYGVVVAKNSTMCKLYQELVRTPYTDFGISDVVVLDSLLNGLYRTRKSSIRQLAQLFEGCGIVPATDLKRWDNIIKK